MSEIILHQYPESPFSEKIRAILGYKGLSYQSVTIPVIMPKPDLMPLTGGYRKTPVMQIGADIYCDSAIIARAINHLHPQRNIFPAGQQALEALAHWTDTFFFKCAVAVAFQPAAAGNNPLFNDPAAVQAFMADRAELSKGSQELAMDLSIAQPYFIQHLKRTDQQLAGSAFMAGSEPSIVDFSTYHCCWFVYGNPALKPLFEPFRQVTGWMERMAAFGHGEVTETEGSAALEIARNSAPVTVAKAGTMDIDSFRPGDLVEVQPIDYGFNPVRGELLLASLEEIVIRRTDDQVGDVAVHFPRLGFRISAAS
ncbi:MAG: glutathione S-transferase family protein [Pseudomonadales bacterium]|nr:glutathione S-transferase family protein [Pseudomonadales bacterium]